MCHSLICFCDLPTASLDYDALTLKICVGQGLVAHKNVNEGWGVSQLSRADDEVKVSHSVAIGTLCPQAPTPPFSRYWYLSSLAMCWVLHASLVHASSCCHSRDAQCCYGKTKLMFHIVSGRKLFLHLFLYWSKGAILAHFHFSNVQIPCNIFWHIWVTILQCAIGN